MSKFFEVPHNPPSVLEHSTLLQRVIIDRPKHLQALYWRDVTEYKNRSANDVKQLQKHLHLSPYTNIKFDTYFNAFHESVWRFHTSIDKLSLRLHVDGPCTIRIVRRTGANDQQCCEYINKDSKEIILIVPNKLLHFRQYGILYFEILTNNHPVSFHGGDWLAIDTQVNEVHLSAVICTLNREHSLSQILQSIAADLEVSRSLAHIFVVNQGLPELSTSASLVQSALQLGSKLAIIDQENFGGAGGFSRGLLEAIDSLDTTHVVLLDDDIILEPDSIIRVAAFFALSKSDMIVGGQMLDSIAPTTLYEAGAIISDRHWSFQPQYHGRDLSDPDILVELSKPTAIHYNGWWCCGIPLSVVQDHGMPLPCFIRGDDLEYGLRLHQAGVVTVAVPGIAVWHEPFYLKGGSWHPYYETRNVLIAASLHQPMHPREVVRRMARQLAMSLLTFHYYDAALVLEGIRDFLAGPDLLKAAPQARHDSLKLISKQYPMAVTARHVVLQEQALAPPPQSTLSFIMTLGWLILSNAMFDSYSTAPRLLQAKDLSWPRMRGVQHIAVETWWDKTLPTFCRSRKHFRTLGFEAVRTLLRLYRLTPTLVQQWQAALPSLASEPFWRDYLGLTRSNIKTEGKSDWVFPPSDEDHAFILNTK